MTADPPPLSEGGFAGYRTPLMTTSLKSRNVVIGKRRTSIRLEEELWVALKALADRGGLTINQLVTAIDTTSGRTGTLTSAVRVFIIKNSSAN